MLLSQDLGVAHTGFVSNNTARHSNEVINGHGLNVESSTESIPVHPLGVKPLGNQYFATGQSARLAVGSNLGILPDEILLQLLDFLDKETLQRLGYTCRFLYAFCQLDELWKTLFLRSRENAIEGFLPWKATWRRTLLELPPDIVPEIDCSNVFSDVLHRPFACSHICLSNYVSAIPRANEMTRLSHLSPADFAAKWNNKPFILTDFVQSWPVFKNWNINKFEKAYSDVEFRAEAVDWPFSVYSDYMHNNDDESPLYLFDRRFAEKTNISIGHGDDCAYWPPECLGEDLFQLLGAERPAHRWLIIGPERSGSTFHKDPNATGAWNAVLQGSKYWLMFPPSVLQPPGVFVSEDSSEVTSPLSIAEYLLTFHEEARRTAGCIEGICREGELLYVPSGWWHLVVNLEPGIALTQNFVTNSRKHLTDVLSFLKDKPDQVTGFSKDILSPYELFVERLRKKQPDLLNEAFAEIERKNGAKKRRWDEAVGATEVSTSATGGFSFGFGGDDLDDNEIP